MTSVGVATRTSTSEYKADLELGGGSPTELSVPNNGIAPMPADEPMYAPGGVAGSVLAPVSYVIDLGVDIQRGFRRKLLTILLIQLCISLGLGLVLRHVIPLNSESCSTVETANGTVTECVVTPGLLLSLFPAQSLQTIILGGLCLVCLPALTYVRDRHPWNMVCTTIWSICWGIVLAAVHVPGGIVRSNALFVIFGTTAVGVAALLVLCTCFTFTNSETGERQLMTFSCAGWLAWVVMLTASIIFFFQTQYLYEQAGHFIGGIIVASLLFAWVAYDSGKLCERMQPDDYMKGVVYFYTDFLIVCCCCLFAGCISSS